MTLNKICHCELSGYIHVVGDEPPECCELCKPNSRAPISPELVQKAFKWYQLQIELDHWIRENFSGHGMAIRRVEDDPIPGEPLMSMDTAKELTKKAVEEFLRRFGNEQSR